MQAWESDSTEPRANKLQMVSALLNVSMVWLMSGLGSGIPPPRELSGNSDNESNTILKELRDVRVSSEALTKRIKWLELKVTNNMKQ